MVTTRFMAQIEAPPRITLDTPLELEYFAEGAAHVVYQIGAPRTRLPLKDDAFESPPDRIPSQDHPLVDAGFKGKLLRLRKDVPSSVPVLESFNFFKSRIEPLFPDGTLLEQTLYEVSPDVIEKYNKELRRDEKQEYLRDSGRGGRYLAVDEPYGTLITEMLWDDEHASCDFKLKWLSPSPSAPTGAKRCRTCALRAMRNPEPNFVTEHCSFCPLVLTAGNESLLRDHLMEALVKMRGAPIFVPEQVNYALPFLMQSPILGRLKELQQKYDPHGPISADLNCEDFRVAMTLRDCTMFMKVVLHITPVDVLVS